MSDSDDEFFDNSAESENVQERKRQYFYDVVLRGAAELKECLEFLSKRPEMKRKTAQRRNFIELTVPEIDLLCNVERKDWDGFHNHYLMKLSK
ncbi:hypothetical protein ACHAXM_005259 [Skeletonema potamos]|jgi:hypothetical protein